MGSLVPLALIARRDVHRLELLPHVGPVIAIAEGRVRLFATEVSEGVVGETKEGLTNLRYTRDDETIADIQHAVADGDTEARLSVKPAAV